MKLLLQDLIPQAMAHEGEVIEAHQNEEVCFIEQNKIAKIILTL